MKQTNEITDLNSTKIHEINSEQKAEQTPNGTATEQQNSTEPTTATDTQTKANPTTEQTQTQNPQEPKTTTAQINAKLWDACNTFRGLMDGSDYKDYILTMLFIKYLSDTYTEKITELKAKSCGIDSVYKALLSKLDFKLEAHSTFAYLQEHKNATNLGELINTALSSLETLNKEKLEGIFTHIDFNNPSKLGDTQQRNTTLKQLINDFSSLDLRPSRLENKDIIGDAYEYLIAKFASDSGKKGGEFYTPSMVSVLLAELVGIKDGEEIYDPTCGSGSLLLKASQKGTNNFIYGQEKNAQTYALCVMNMFLHNIPNPKIKWGDTLTNPLHLDTNGDLRRFSKIVANPPFSLDKWGYEELKEDRFSRFNYGMPPKSKGDYAFLLHMIKSLKNGGTLGVVMPHGVLFRGSSEGKIRASLIKQGYLKAIIGLPSNLFYGTSIPACIMIFSKEQNEKVIFIDASSCYEKGKNQNTLKDIDKILNAYHGNTDINGFCKVVSLDEIEQNDFNLNIPRYVVAKDKTLQIDYAELKEQISSLNAKLELSNAKLQGYLKELGL